MSKTYKIKNIKIIIEHSNICYLLNIKAYQESILYLFVWKHFGLDKEMFYIKK